MLSLAESVLSLAGSGLGPSGVTEGPSDVTEGLHGRLLGDRADGVSKEKGARTLGLKSRPTQSPAVDQHRHTGTIKSH